MKTLIGKTPVSYKYIISFEELHPNMYFSFHEMDFSNEFHGIIGFGMLSQLQSKLDLQHNLITMNGITLPISRTPDEFPNALIFTNTVEENQFRLDHLNPEEKHYLSKVLKKFDDVFYHEGDTLSFTNQVKHKIRTKHEDPIYSKLYRYPQKYREEVDKQINDMLGQGIIRHSNSPYSAPIWIVPKKLDASGKPKFRLVVDYRKINDITISDKFPIPNIDEILDKMGRAMYFSTLDLAKGFHQIEVHPEDIPKTAFSTSSGHYEWLRMPFGLCNAPATFQRLMNQVLAEHIGKICFVYLDDIIIFSTSLQEHVQSLEKIFKSLRDANLKVQLDKSEFLKHETEYLGHIISDKGVRPNPNKTEAIKRYNIPKTQKQIRQFLGLCGFFRKFICGFSQIARPMTKYLKLNSKININDPHYINAFEKLKILLTSDPILAYPDFNKEFVLTTDASNQALGAVLSQNGHPICYASRTLNEHEINYATFEKELLAIVWATKYFRCFLFGRKFKIRCDQRSLQWLHNTKDPNSRVLRWKIRLSEFDYTIEYLKGKDNYVADALSRPVNILTRAQKKLVKTNNRQPQRKIDKKHDITSRITRSKTRNDASRIHNGISQGDATTAHNDMRSNIDKSRTIKHISHGDATPAHNDKEMSTQINRPRTIKNTSQGTARNAYDDDRHDTLSRIRDNTIPNDARNSATKNGLLKSRVKKTRDQIEHDKQSRINDIMEFINDAQNSVNEYDTTHTSQESDLREEGSLMNETHSSYNSVNVEPSLGTRHSADEDSSQLIAITERPINVFEHQFYFIKGIKEGVNSFSRHRKKVIKFTTPEFSEEYFTKIIKDYVPCTGVVAVYFDEIKDFHLFQLTYRKIKSPDLPVKLFKASYELKEIKTLAELQDIILDEHKHSNHRGIDATFHTLRYQIYWPNLKKEITKVINNCPICNIAKYDRTPLKLPFKETYTPSKCREIFQIDIWQPNSSEYFLSCIDLHSKYAQVYKLDGRTWIDAKRALIKIFNDMGKPIEIKADLDPGLRSSNLCDWLLKEGVKLISTTSKTGIADIERFHGSLNEHIRILRHRDDVRGLNLVETALYHYNTSYHSTIEDVPQRVHLNNKNMTQILLRNKQSRLKRVNRNRIERPINKNYILRPRIRKLDDPKRKLNQVRKINQDHYEEIRRNNVRRVLYKANFVRKKNYAESM